MSALFCPLSTPLKYTFSGGYAKNPKLEKLIKMMLDGDILVVWRLDYLSLSVDDLLESILRLRKKGIEFISLEDFINTTAPGGDLVFHIIGVLNSYNRNQTRRKRVRGVMPIIERRRRIGKNPLREKDIENLKKAVERYRDEPDTPVKIICDETDVKRSTFYKYMSEYGKTSNWHTPSNTKKNVPLGVDVFFEANSSEKPS
jgi:DNA invertase Pin-like site-specific DNA recombinase